MARPFKARASHAHPGRAHGQDARATHGRDARATITAPPMRTTGAKLQIHVGKDKLGEGGSGKAEVSDLGYNALR